MNNPTKIDINVDDIEIKISKTAFKQILLIKENDYTLNDEVFRLQINGKGCTGFEYALGFSDSHPEDLHYDTILEGENLTISIDPFTAFYCKSGNIEYMLDIENDIEGFHFENNNQTNYKGKFFKKESTIPPMVK